MREIRAAHALTVKNPWAHMIAWVGKNVENRTWMPHEGVDTLLIHAGKTRDPFGPDYATGIDEVSCAIVAVADLAFACNTSRYSDTVRCSCGEWAQPGQCHWVLANVMALSEPVECSGRQGLWTPTADVLAAVNRQLAVTR